ncbi:MAG: acyl--CoA ligase [Pseudobacteriovorax sp.]|nr:acyl--CoA ligase [Pseudobacteriovorax sp.]
MTTHVDTLVSDNLRATISADPQIGAGNFLRTAMQVNSKLDDPILFLQLPLQTPWGAYQTLSLNQIDNLSRKIASWYRKQGISTGDPVAIYLDDGIEYLVHYLSLVILGAIPVLINGNMPADLLEKYLERVQCRAIYSDEHHLPMLLRLRLKSEAPIFSLQDIDPKATPLSNRDDYKHAADDPIMIAHSSGTTGVPKAVILEHEKFFYGIRYRLKFPRIHGGERILSSLPHSHNCAIAYLTLALLSGTPVFICSDHSGAAVLKRSNPLDRP